MEKFLHIVFKAALEAGKTILEVYQKPFEVALKDDASPVTQADIQASNIIKKNLQPTQLPFVSEEDIPGDRSSFSRYWLVDPLDGTKEFVRHNDEFTVNIALIDNKIPVLGVIYAPVFDTLWYTINNGVFKVCHAYATYPSWTPQLLTLADGPLHRPYTVLVSRSHRTQEVDDYINHILRPQHPDLVINSQGSSLKFAQLIENNADIYVCYSKTKEWDTAAADALLTAFGGHVLRISDGRPLEYSKLDYPNPPFVAVRC